MGHYVPVRDYFPGMGSAVADRTVNRKIFTDAQRQALPDLLKINPMDKLANAWQNAAVLSEWQHVMDADAAMVERLPETRSETWSEVSNRVAKGNTGLLTTEQHGGLQSEGSEFLTMRKHLMAGSLLMSGRHLQHGDSNQKNRPMEVFTNCLDASTRILTMEYGPIEIGKIVDETVTVIAGDGVPRPALISQHGEQLLFDITFRSVKGGGGNYRKTVRATKDHRWLLREGGVTHNLREKDVLKSIPGGVSRDPEGVLHGLIFGDGTAHKGRRDNGRVGISVGRTYASIRVCKQDAVKDEIHSLLDLGGYKFSTPTHSAGDRVYYIGKSAHSKELPFCKDPEYIAGFIYGWWLADGSKSVAGGILEISTADTLAADWLDENAGYAGMNVTMRRVMDRKEGDGSYANGKSLNILRMRENVEWVVESMVEAGVMPVYCPEEPVTSSFVLANGLLTGNCATSAASFLEFYLLLNGSGVGRAYDDAMMKVDWNMMPTAYVAIASDHPDRLNGRIPNDVRTVEEYQADFCGEKITVFTVPDSRGGWAKAFEILERMAFEKRVDEVLILDFSLVRPNGSPIRGMQNRPSSGPGPVMLALQRTAAVKLMGFAPWKATMFVDHYSAECVLVGGARRAARMATKFWKDATIFEFISIKKDGGLWTSNNSVTIDDEFRERCTRVAKWIKRVGRELADKSIAEHKLDPQDAHAWKVLNAVAKAAYFDGTGEPGLINQDRLTSNDDGIEDYLDGMFAESKDFQLDPESLPMMRELAQAVIGAKYSMIVNPCGEIALLMLGAYCVIADVVPFHALDDNDAEQAFRTAVRALIRTNTMDSLYKREVKRTNRIGVGITGFHEWVYDRFKFAWKDIVNETTSKEMWLMMSRFKRAIVAEAKFYSKALGFVCPHTDTTFKPAGTTSKLFGLTEGAHLPPLRWYLRWVQFRNDDPLVAEYAAKGYPIRNLMTYEGTTIVGFPTAPTICQMDGGDWITTAGEATPEEQYQFLRLLEKYWITGVEEDGVTPLSESGNQVSYTLKYQPDLVSYEEFFESLVEGQFSVRCCSVMPQINDSAYEYVPEEAITKEVYDDLLAKVTGYVREDIGFEHLDCSSGACPISWIEDEAA